MQNNNENLCTHPGCRQHVSNPCEGCGRQWGEKMKIKAEKIKAKDLKPGDLFSTEGQGYWDTIDNNLSVGERVYIRTNSPTPLGQGDDEVYRITIER